jgi:dihydropyrimidine dehydrogenase (NAD+) subunit PreA
MVNLATKFAGIRSPNPFWVASGPPSNTAYQCHRAFEAGWGGLVWKTIGDPIVNVSSRYAAHKSQSRRLIGFTNIELISDRAPEINFKEIYDCKRSWPDRAIIASLMVDTRERWHEFVKRAIDAGADGIELNFGCPHGMCERGMGSAVGQNPDVAETIVSWVMEAASGHIPVIAKLTPNITDITTVARAVARAGANAISLINTLSSIPAVNLDTFVPEPYVDGCSTYGGYSGTAVKPIALKMLYACAQDPQINLPLSGIGGISSWHDAAEFIALGATTVQVCTAIMHRGFGIVQKMIDGLRDYLTSKGFSTIQNLHGRALTKVQKWESLNLNYKRIAQIDYTRCIACDLCYTACEDGAYQAIEHIAPASLSHLNPNITNKLLPRIREESCVGCNLCAIVCPINDCITMIDIPNHSPSLSWKQYQQQLSQNLIAPIPPKP